MPNWVVDLNLLRAATVFKMNLKGIRNRTLVRFEVFLRVSWILMNLHLVTQLVDYRISFVEAVFIMLCYQVAKGEWYSCHVLKTVVAVGWVVQRARLTNDANSRLVGMNHDLFDLVQTVFYARV